MSSEKKTDVKPKESKNTKPKEKSSEKVKPNQQKNEKAENPPQPPQKQENPASNEEEKKENEEEKQKEQDLNEENEPLPQKEEEENLQKKLRSLCKEGEMIADPNYKDTLIKPDEDFNSEIIPKRKFKYKILITRPKRDFDDPQPLTMFYVKTANEESTTGNNEIKFVKQANINIDYPMEAKPYIEMGFQTANSFVTKGFQVAKKEYKNSYTQVMDDFSDIKGEFLAKKEKYLNDADNLRKIENFLIKVRPRMEQSLQSNETINIFMNDFDLDKITHVQSEDKKNKGQEIRTFRDNSAGNKNKKEKCVYCIRSINETIPVLCHSLYRNIPFEEKIKVLGIPYQSQILFWNIRDVEQNSPIFAVDTQSEITCFEFDSNNCNNCICALASGQVMFIKFNNIIETLKGFMNIDYSITSKTINIKDYYIFKICKQKDGHKERISALKWFPPGYWINKKNQIAYSPEEKDTCIAASLGEDGNILLWDYKGIEFNDMNAENQETEIYIKSLKIEVNKKDSIGKICGMGLQLEITIDHKVFFFVSTEDSQVYCIDNTKKNTSDNPTANVIQCYYNKYYRPCLYFEVSPFFDNIFLTVHDFHFCLWSKDLLKPIFISSNLKKSSYTCGKFSPSRPGVLYLCRTTGKIDIWDFLDESHKPSVKDCFLKDKITSINLFRYIPEDNENNEEQTKTLIEYMAIGDVSGQMTILEVPKLFCEESVDERKLMKDFFDNEINRVKYMDMRYKKLEDDLNNAVVDKVEIDENSPEYENNLKYEEDEFNAAKRDILLELGIEPPKTEEELAKEKAAKEKENNNNN